MWELHKQPWPWYTSGVLIPTIMVLLTYFGKSFGVSSSLRTVCSTAGAANKVKFFDATVQDLQVLGINFGGELNPSLLFGMDAALSFKGFMTIAFGSELVGDGVRYAGGCKSGHAKDIEMNFTRYLVG